MLNNPYLRKSDNMKKALVIILSLIVSLNIIAQKPSWTDYYNRSEMYPENEYLIGFVSGYNNQDRDPGELKRVYENMAKDKLIQSLQVEIETMNKLNITNENGRSGEEFSSESVSFSKASIAGMITQSYYDRRKNEVFALALVNKKELAYYYKTTIRDGMNAIEQKLKEGRKYTSRDDKKNALRSYYESMPFMVKIDEAKTALSALNRKYYTDFNREKYDMLKLELIEEIKTLVNPEDLDLSDAAYFAAYGISLQLDENVQNIFLEDISYKNTRLTSDFSKQWKAEFETSLLKIKDYQLVENGRLKNSVAISGNYWMENDIIKISILASIDNNLVAASNASLQKQWADSNDIHIIPEVVLNLNKLNNKEIVVVEFPDTIISGIQSSEKFKLKVQNILTGESISGFPVSITSDSKTETLFSASTDKDGLIEGTIPIIETDKGMIRFVIAVDLEKYLNITNDHSFYEVAMVQNPVLPVLREIIVAKPTVYIESSEKIGNKLVEISVLEPSVKEFLTNEGFSFLPSEGGADYIIKIVGQTTGFNEHQGIHFAYVDVNLSMVNNLTGEELTKFHIDQVKGGGANKNKASITAYNKASEILIERLKEYIGR